MTLTGPGGSGKTRLAIETARELADDFDDGVYWVPLQSLRDSKLVLPTVAGAVAAKGELTRHIGEKELLLVVDNTEHLPEAVSDLASLLSVCPNLVLLATGREPLRVAAEREYQVEPMSESDAISLFCERAYRTEPIETVAEICEKLDRLPLAIELAAARTKTLGLDEILARLDQRLEFLTGGPQDAPARQQTLRAAIEWSYDLLSAEEQRVHTGLAVFRGGSTLAAAAAVCETDESMLDSLCDKHLVKLTDGRYTMLETIHEHAHQRLEDSGDATENRALHARWYLALAEEFGAEVPNALGANFETYQRWLSAVEADLDNFRAAMGWSIDQGERERALRIAIGLAAYWARGGRHGIEGTAWLSEALAATGPTADLTRARGQYLLGQLLVGVGRAEEAERALLEALELYRAAEDGYRIAAVVRGLAMAAHELGELDKARALYADAIELWPEHGHLWIDHNLAQVELEAGNVGHARELLERALREAQELKQLRFVGSILCVLAQIDLEEGLLDRAEDGYRQSLHMARLYAWDALICQALGGLAVLCAERGDLERAGRLRGAAQAQDVYTDRPSREFYCRLLDSRLEPEFLHGLEEGRTLSLEDAVGYALGESA